MTLATIEHILLMIVLVLQVFLLIDMLIRSIASRKEHKEFKAHLKQMDEDIRKRLEMQAKQDEELQKLIDGAKENADEETTNGEQNQNIS